MAEQQVKSLRQQKDELLETLRGEARAALERLDEVEAAREALEARAAGQGAAERGRWEGLGGRVGWAEEACGGLERLLDGVGRACEQVCVCIALP